jgi:hypothetical protein
LLIKEERVERSSVSRRHCSVNSGKPPRNSLQTNRRGCDVAIALTKEALWVAVLLSSLALWAAIWAGAASLASAWLQ